mmetsp:Transcript_27543/g.32580  ORF Transcript_27543/g.32580 Transcript_27543/m.32580 type:complete len:378 (+) Transcript_27543:215-1348(+)
MTRVMNETLPGRATPQFIEELDMKKNGKKNRSIIQRFSSKKKNHSSKKIKDTPRRIDIDPHLLLNKHVELTSDDETDTETFRDSFTDSFRNSFKKNIEPPQLVHKIKFISSSENFSDADHSNGPPSLSWQNRYPIIPVESENALLPTLLPWGDKERGMIKNHPPFRVSDLQWSCRTNIMHLEQALSLRRHHIKLLNPLVRNMTKLGLGSNFDIRDAENQFEIALMKYLKELGIPFRTEEDKRRRFIEESKPGESMQLSPDFMLTNPINLITLQATNEESTITEQGQINWIEAKMFYGASTIPDGTSNAVGAILRTAKKYIENYGPGAFVFSYGCGIKLRGHLEDLGISVLDSNPLNMEEMENHQRGWCADKNGTILP